MTIDTSSIIRSAESYTQQTDTRERMETAVRLGSECAAWELRNQNDVDRNVHPLTSEPSEGHWDHLVREMGEVSAATRRAFQMAYAARIEQGQPPMQARK